jgi:carbonic anhydrase
MEKLVERFRRFREEAFPVYEDIFRTLAHAQSPHTLFIGCSDSRVVPELQPGEMFVIRNAGNIVPPYGSEASGVAASIEYAVAVLGVRDVVVCGHSDCGAMTAVAHNHDLSRHPVSHWLRHAHAAEAVNAARRYRSDAATLDGMIRQNVVAQIANLRTHPSVALALAQHRLTLHGWVYDIATGQIDALDGATGRFVPLSEHRGVSACGSTLHDPTASAGLG